MLQIKKILFPCDLTQHSYKILKYALALAEYVRQPDLHSARRAGPAQLGGPLHAHKRLELEQKEVVEHAQKSLVQFCLDIPEARTNAEKRVVSGEPAEEIIKSVGEEGADLIVMGTHGPRAWSIRCSAASLPRS